MKNFQLVSVGDATWDVFITPTESETFCTIDDRESMLCFVYGDKIPVKSLDFSIGGNAANNAVGTARLGIDNAAILTLGDDETGVKIKKKFEEEGVDTSYVYKQEGSESNYYTIVVVAGERTIFGHKTEKNYQFPDNLPETEWVYLTSMAENFHETYAKCVDWVKSNDIKLAFNPGSRQVRAGTDSLRNVLEVTYACYVNRSEAEELTGMEGSEGKDRELLQALSSLGPKISIITDGANGSFVHDTENQKFYHAGILPVDAYERTGAGDAFGSGCIAALIKGKSFEEALLWGTLNSASVIGYTGSQKGLLKEDQMPEWLERARSSEVSVREL